MKRRTILVSLATVGVTGCLHDSGKQDMVNEKGEIEITVNGEPIDLTQERLQSENAENSSLAFHFHDSDGLWYMEGERVTFAEGIDLLPYFAYEKETGHVLTYDGKTYDEADKGTEISFSVGSEVIDPTEYELRGGESLRVEVKTNAER